MPQQKTKVRFHPQPESVVVFTLTTRVAAVDRVHRIGQEKTVYVKHYIVSALPSAFHPFPNMISGIQHNRGSHSTDSEAEDGNRE